MLGRGAIDWPQFLTGRSMLIAGGMAAKLVIFSVAEGSRPNHRLTNWAVLVKIAEPGVAPRKEDWSRLGRVEELMPHVGRFRIPYVDAKALIEATPEFWEYPMCDRDPLPRWSHGRVSLLGDAGHPMYPVGSNGASQAILDARSLADWLRSAEHPAHALWMYEQERLPMTAQVVQMNRKASSTQWKRARPTDSAMSRTCSHSSSARRSCADMRRPPALRASRSTEQRNPFDSHGRISSTLVLVDKDRGRHSSPIVIGAPQSEQSSVLCNKIDVGCLFWLQEDRSLTPIERVGIFNLHRGEKIGSGKVMPLFPRIDQVQLVR